MTSKREHIASRTYCRGCIHLTTVADWPCCNYLINTDQRRPCPAGDGCTVKETKKRKRKEQKMDNFDCAHCDENGFCKLYSEYDLVWKCPGNADCGGYQEGDGYGEEA